MTPSALDRIDQYLHTAPRVLCDVVPVPPFTLYLNRETDSPFTSYARPSAPLEEVDTALAAVLEAFAERRRQPRWEWIDDLHPELAPALERLGITPEVNPLMRISRESFHPVEPRSGLELRIPAEADLRAMVEAQRRSFGMDEPASEADVAMVRRWLERGGRFYAAFAGHQAVGGGGYLPIEGVAEVAGVGTVPEFRRRGVAAAVTSALVRDAFRDGCDCVFLTAGDEAAVHLYEKVGFEVVARGMGAMG